MPYLLTFELVENMETDEYLELGSPSSFMPNNSHGK